MQPKFLNTVIKLNTFQTPQRLLQMLKDLEFEMGRDPEMDPRDPRIVDLDLLRELYLGLQSWRSVAHCCSESQYAVPSLQFNANRDSRAHPASFGAS